MTKEQIKISNPPTVCGILSCKNQAYITINTGSEHVGICDEHLHSLMITRMMGEEVIKRSVILVLDVEESTFLVDLLSTDARTFQYVPMSVEERYIHARIALRLTDKLIPQVEAHATVEEQDEKDRNN